jgi:hypothetical protein
MSVWQDHFRELCEHVETKVLRKEHKFNTDERTRNKIRKEVDHQLRSLGMLPAETTKP